MEISAITLVTSDMRAALGFWAVLDLEITYGGPEAPFTTLRLGENFVNLVADRRGWTGFWGRVVIHVPSPDKLWQDFADAGYRSQTEPADAPWGERYFHILDPDGHELSFARPLVTP